MDVRELIDRKSGRRVSVVVPALDDEDTVAGVVASVRPLLGGLIDELIVLDAGSTDRTVARAQAAGAAAYTLEEAMPGVPPRPGKGEVVWRSLAVATGDLLVYLDADLVAPDPLFVPALLTPLLTEPGITLVKGFYRRPITTGAQLDADGGGRVTQLVARPLLTALAPALAEIVQPLGGEYAVTRAFLGDVPLAGGYGAEIGILLDCWQRHGLSAIAQVDLGVRVHRNRPTHELAVMSRQVVATLLDRLGIRDSGIGLVQFLPCETGWRRTPSEVSLVDRPPMRRVVTAHREIA
ncbi:glucosyl-3-phosphoglycerate synthase [Nocardia coubleae]|uniref:Glucosyl-3-phosphoglycerate synthase n=1 Tax=Nocardia coubleae TaxID=356147 RepID=A0A846W0I8_9NOCA|nr:glucosyl-3-phosphoglycerate synthase [Nocardia coubleae]NKX86403.1 glucosyl-3-phosphoglycerate synthase [Nocardia coubleae]